MDGRYLIVMKIYDGIYTFFQAKEIERERNLILSGAGDSVPDELSSSVFSVNKKTNQHICNKREKVALRLIFLGIF